MTKYKINFSLLLTLSYFIIQTGELPLHSAEKSLNFKKQNFFIKKEYISRKKYHQFNDTKYEDQYQDEVYKAAFELASKQSCYKIADIGCGSGFKLIKYFKNFDTIGFDLEPSFSFLKTRYPDRKWVLSDFSLQDNLMDFDLIICSDVIEHLLNPDELLNWINNLNFKYLVISTPDRDLLAKKLRKPQVKKGPPVNKHHIREWNFAEFNQYISQFFNVIDHFHTKKEWWGQTIIATKKH